MNKTKKKSKQFTITLNERQLELLAYACRVTDRLIIGQHDEAADVLFDMQKVIEHALWLEEDPKKRCRFTNDAFEHTIEYGKEKNIIVKLCPNNE